MKASRSSQDVVRSMLSTSPRAVVYARVSTARQAEEGVSIEAQLEACRRFAAGRGWTVVGEFVDRGISGKDEVAKRPELAAALSAVRTWKETKGPGQRDVSTVLVVYSISRLARRQRILWELLDPAGGHGLAVASVTEPFETTTPMGRAMLGMIAVWSQLEADMISQRTRDALAHVKATGKKLGQRSARSLVEPGTLKFMQGLRKFSDGSSMTYDEIAQCLNSQGFPTPTGRGKWWPRTVRAVLTG